MKILYDHQIFSLQKYGGVSRYFCELMKNLPVEHTFELSVSISDNHYLREDSSFFKKKNIPIPKWDFKGKGFLKEKMYQLNNNYSKKILSKNDYNIFHPTFYDSYFLESLKAPYIITVHDLTAFKFKDSYLKDDIFRVSMEKAIMNANRIIAISENTKIDLCEHFKIKDNKIDVIYHGFNYTHGDITKNKWGDYILFVGRRSGYKNFSLFTKAISSLLLKNKSIKLICVGEVFSPQEKSDLKDLSILKQTYVIAADEQTLNSLYKHALVFVFPSLYEGFGMPILEAFSNDCPIALSNTSCFPEIAEDAGTYFDPECADSLHAAVSTLIDDRNLADQKISLGREKLSKFSWKKTAEQTSISYSALM